MSRDTRIHLGTLRKTRGFPEPKSFVTRVIIFRDRTAVRPRPTRFASLLLLLLLGIIIIITILFNAVSEWEKYPVTTIIIRFCLIDFRSYGVRYEAISETSSLHRVLRSTAVFAREHFLLH